jgi:Family of unknown function (DUF6169)
MESNLSSPNPYLTYQEKNGNDIFFTTDSGEDYIVYFSESDGYFPDLTYSAKVKGFGFRPVRKNSSIKLDQRISDTIISLLNIYLSDNQSIILYVCDQSDGKQHFRNRLFNSWFSKYGKGLTKIGIEFDGQTFISAISSDQNPLFQDFQNTFLNLGNQYK